MTSRVQAGTALRICSATFCCTSWKRPRRTMERELSMRIASKSALGQPAGIGGRQALLSPSSFATGNESERSKQKARKDILPPHVRRYIETEALTHKLGVGGCEKDAFT